MRRITSFFVWLAALLRAWPSLRHARSDRRAGSTLFAGCLQGSSRAKHPVYAVLSPARGPRKSGGRRGEIVFQAGFRVTACGQPLLLDFKTQVNAVGRLEVYRRRLRMSEPSSKKSTWRCRRVSSIVATMPLSSPLRRETQHLIVTGSSYIPCWCRTGRVPCSPVSVQPPGSARRFST